MNDSPDPNHRYVTPIGTPDPAAVASFWARFLHASGSERAESAPSAWCFGDSVELADELVELVVHGPKRATAGALSDYEAEGEPVPAVGDRSIVTDGMMRPRARAGSDRRPDRPAVVG